MFFTKMNGLGNDFIVIEHEDSLKNKYSKLALNMCNRHFGVGADGILVVDKSEIADSKMLIYNSDGSEAEMCGNGIRCFAKYLFDKGIVKRNIISIETLNGVKKIELEIKNDNVAGIKVNMGTPVFEPHLIPAHIEGDKIISKNIKIDDDEYSITSMLMGVPHTIVFVDEIADNYVIETGQKIEKSVFFPKRTNVNFVRVINDGEFDVRTWERGAGLTMACGTGTCASLIACALNNKTKKSALAHLKGGDLFIDWSESKEVYMSGPAVTVFNGEYMLSI